MSEPVEDMDKLLFRDKIACKMCNWILINIASTRYKNMVEGLIKAGMFSILDQESSPNE